MEKVNITIGRLTFDRANYDAENDVRLAITVPETIETTAEDLEPALATA